MGVDLGQHYRETRLRLTAVLEAQPEDAWARPVAACPGWDVKAVVSHLVGIIEDAAAGLLTGPPTEEQTAAEVARHADDDPGELLARWAELAPSFEPLLTELAIWPAAIDVMSHEHDIRHALEAPGGRDTALVRAVAEMLVTNANLPRPLVAETTHGRWSSGGSGAPLVLRSEPFEIVRIRLGRRSRSQVEALDWSEPPREILDDLFIFGPAAVAIVE